MNEPDAPLAGGWPERPNTSSEQPVNNSTAGDAVQDKPEYGQCRQPAYGAMAAQFGPHYNPYLYGAPDPQSPQPGASAAPDGGGRGASTAMGQTPPQGNGDSFAGRSYAQSGQGPFQQGQPNYLNGIDLNDPNQNPLYGHWDMYAIVSLVLAVCFPVPVLSALMGAMAMRRCKMFHMKGYGLGLAAVIINVCYTIAVIWMAVNGVDVFTLYQQMLSELQGGSSSDGDGAISA